MLAQSGEIDDVSATRRVQLIAGGLALLGALLIAITVWFWRSTRPDPRALAPLEEMGHRRWRRRDQIERRHRLDDVRPHLNDDEAFAAREVVALGSTVAPSTGLAELVAAAPTTSGSLPPPHTPADPDAVMETVHGDPLVPVNAPDDTGR
jgi:hypothetical protein